MTIRTGGVHHCMVMHAGLWYQAFDNSLLVIAPESGFVIDTVELGTPDHAPPVVDMVVHNESLYVVLEADTVVRLSLEIPQAPAVVEEIDTRILDVRPYTLSVAGGRLFASGDGGVIDLDDRAIISRSALRAGRVVMAADELVVTAGRQALRARDGELLGTATDLYAIPDSFMLDGRLIGVRQRDDGALISLLNEQLREVEGDGSSTAVPGQVRRIRFIDDRMWIVNDDAIRSCRLSADGIAVEQVIEVLGARDLARDDDNHLLVAGAFGRAAYRERTDASGPGDEFLNVYREPSGLVNTVTDGRYLLAGGPLGHWRYLIGQQFAELNARVITQPQPSARSAQARGATLRFEDDDTVVAIDADGVTWRYREAGDVRFHCVAAIEGHFWVGHDHGLTVLRARPAPVPSIVPKDSTAVRSEPSRVMGRLRFEGPVRFIYPLATGRGGAFVSEFGGFGVAEIKAVPITDLPPMPRID